MIIQIKGLDFDVSSPSYYRLVLPNKQDTIDISFLGDEWCLFLERNGNVSTRTFPDRDQAIGMVVQAFANESLL